MLGAISCRPVSRPVRAPAADRRAPETVLGFERPLFGHRERTRWAVRSIEGGGAVIINSASIPPLGMTTIPFICQGAPIRMMVLSNFGRTGSSTDEKPR